MYDKGRPCILVVDDSEMNRALLTDILSDSYEIVTAGHGQEAINILSERKDGIGLVLLDIVMPVMTGYDVLVYMEGWDLLSRIPVIVMSTAGEVADIRKAYRYGASEFLDKVFDHDVVRNRVDMVIRAFASTHGTHAAANRSGVYEELARVIKFEYDKQTDQVVLFPFGAKVLSLPTVMDRPLADSRSFAAMAEPDVVSLVDMLRSTSPGNPYVYYKCKLTIDGEEKYYQAALKATWDGSMSPARYNGCVGTLIDVDVFEREAEKWSAEARVDSLTGLLRNEYAKTCIEERVRERPDMKFLFMLIDLDKFKQANDTYGHEFGNRVLSHVGKVLRGTVRGGDIVARMGGDEFIVFLEYSCGEDVVARRIFDALCHRLDDKFDISASIGIATSDEVGTAYQDMFEAADKALYGVKDAGRHGYAFYRSADKK